MTTAMERGELPGRKLAGLPRVLGRYGGRVSGPVLLCLAGIHGNEPAGIVALQRVFSALHRTRPVVQGELIGIVGNLQALACRRRYLQADLNRIWSPAHLRTMHTADRRDAECAEQHDLVQLFDQELADKDHAVYFMDLHTASAHTVPFALIGDSLPNRRFALHFPVPLVLGLEERLSGTISEYLNGRGVITLGFESGQHEDANSIALHEAAIWMGMHAAGLLVEPLEQVHQARVLLRGSYGTVPRVLEVRYRQPAEVDGDFRMITDFTNFQPVTAGQPLAIDHSGEIRAHESALIFLPRYQKLSEDGFFLVRPVHPAWLKISEWLRALWLPQIVHYLPGVQRHPSRPNTLIADPHWTRWLVVELFHLLGFKQCTPEDGKLVFSRRVHDLPGRRVRKE